MVEDKFEESIQRVALITGAGRGIGAETARYLSEKGIRVVCTDLTMEALPEGLRGSGHTFCEVDVRSEESCCRAVEHVLDSHGRIDYLVNNAGIVRRGPASTMSVQDFSDVIDTNLIGAFRMSQQAYHALKISRGSIVNVGSTNGSIAVKNSVGYCVSKAGVMHLGKVLALEWAVDGIRVNSVGPTIVETDMTADLRLDPVFMAEKLSTIPLGRMATRTDVAQAIYFLLSSDSKMVTGQTIFVDGGVLTH